MPVPETIAQPGSGVDQDTGPGRPRTATEVLRPHAEHAFADASAPLVLRGVRMASSFRLRLALVRWILRVGWRRGGTGRG